MLEIEPEIVVAWGRRIVAEFEARNITRGERDALLAFRYYLGPDGLFPSEATLAARACCSTRTVRRAKARGSALGLLSWTHRRASVSGRWRRTSNSYRLAVPRGGPVPRPASCGQKGGRERSARKSVAREPVHRVHEFPPDVARLALARRRDAVEAQLRAGLAAKHVRRE